MLIVNYNKSYTGHLRCLGDYRNDGVSACPVGQHTKPLLHVRAVSRTLCPLCLYLLPKMIALCLKRDGLEAYTVVEVGIAPDSPACTPIDNLIRKSYDAALRSYQT